MVEIPEGLDLESMTESYQEKALAAYKQADSVVDRLSNPGFSEIIDAYQKSFHTYGLDSKFLLEEIKESTLQSLEKRLTEEELDTFEYTLSASTYRERSKSWGNATKFIGEGILLEGGIWYLGDLKWMAYAVGATFLGMLFTGVGSALLESRARTLSMRNIFAEDRVKYLKSEIACLEESFATQEYDNLQHHELDLNWKKICKKAGEAEAYDRHQEVLRKLAAGGNQGHLSLAAPSEMDGALSIATEGGELELVPD
tara:strand:+ start:25154 stop:25921 length:768 start_codon:yes stop_codon:yes gene_type:complete